MTKHNARLVALDVLLQVNEEGAYANIALDKVLLACQGVDNRDKGLITELVYGSIKNRGRLDYILNQFAKSKVTKMDKVSRNILRMAVYQLLFCDKIPPSAAINEAVKMAKLRGKRGSDKFINGVLRNIERGRETIAYPNKGRQPVQYLSVYYSFPQWIVERWYKDYGAKAAEKTCQYFNKPQTLWIRANTLKITPEDLAEAFTERGIVVKRSEHIPEGLMILDSVNLHQLDLFQEGYFMVQDESSMHVAHAAAPKEGQRILDVCSAPGGKTTHLAQLMNNTGEIIACDIYEHRLKLIEENAKRLGITTITPRLQDGTALNEAFGAEFDVVLVDAPCSGLGVLGRRADARWSKRLSDVQTLAKLQREILHQSALVTKIGGTLIYSTCTTTKEENWQQVANFLAEHEDFELLGDLAKCWQNTDKGEDGQVQFLPHLDQMDGFFIARFRRKGGAFNDGTARL